MERTTSGLSRVQNGFGTLNSLDLCANYFTGTLPSELGQLTQRYYLDLADNSKLTSRSSPKLRRKSEMMSRPWK